MLTCTGFLVNSLLAVLTRPSSQGATPPGTFTPTYAISASTVTDPPTVVIAHSLALDVVPAFATVGEASVSDGLAW